tara:strand:+ start:161578 stop:162390 length:813 start_codon:yes stop_codon:yes gene_type:complete
MFFSLTFLSSTAIVCFGQSGPDDHSLALKKHQELTARLQKAAEELTKKLLEKSADRVSVLSQRGDAWFFLGEFKKSVADYEEMVELDPEQGDSHWRRGIARFYAGQVKEAAEQFEAYHSYDDIDRENGIWRYFSQYRAYGQAKAKEGLLKYRKTDREPFPDVYRLFSGDTTPKQILEAINQAEISQDERKKRLFYAQLYIGLNHAVEGRNAEAIVHLRESTANQWGPNGGYGPRYMWHVGRVHLDLLLNEPEKKNSKNDTQQTASPKGGR